MSLTELGYSGKCQSNHGSFSNPNKCYKLGDDWPKLQSGLLRLYTMRFCPYSHRVRLVLEYKTIPYDIVHVYLRDKCPEWIRNRHPTGGVPVIETDDGRVLYESIVCAQYADDANPQSRLTPADPYTKAKHSLLICEWDKVISAYREVVNSLHLDVVTEKWDEVLNQLDKFELEIGCGKYFGGPKPSLLDLVIWPWFERSLALAHINQDLTLPHDRLPRLCGWQATMLRLPAVKQCAIDVESHAVYIRSCSDKEPNYSYGLE